MFLHATLNCLLFHLALILSQSQLRPCMLMSSLLSHLETQLDPPPPPHFPHRYIYFTTRTVDHNIINCAVKPLLSGHQSINFLKFSSLIKFYCKFDLYSTVCLYSADVVTIWISQMAYFIVFIVIYLC